MDFESLSYCESVTASAFSPWCVRELTHNGRFFGGGIDTDSLCGRVSDGQGWDLKDDVDIDDENMCLRCRKKIEFRHGL